MGLRGLLSQPQGVVGLCQEGQAAAAPAVALGCEASALPRVVQSLLRPHHCYGGSEAEAGVSTGPKGLSHREGPVPSATPCGAREPQRPAPPLMGPTGQWYPLFPAPILGSLGSESVGLQLCPTVRRQWVGVARERDLGWA